MAKSELVYEFQGSQNLNTTPIDITGLQGDTYDYELITWFDVETANIPLNMTFNNDTSANYRTYTMKGDGSSATAAVADSNSAINAGGQAHSYPSFKILTITGSSGDERYIDSLEGRSQGSGDTRVQKFSNYWKNTADEITSIQLTKTVSVTSTCHILLYRTLKTASQGNWEKVDELTWAAESTEKSFTGLDGDRDKKYKIVTDCPIAFRVEVNNDSGSNYIRQALRNGSGTIGANNSTDPYYSINGRGEFIINAETGAKRLCTVSGSKTVSWQQTEYGFWYTNTATNVTTLDCTPSASTTCTATLYRMKSGTETDGVLNWELIESVDVSGDFSSGYSFNNLQGDSVKLYRLEWLGEITTQGIRMRFNGDTTGGNYIEQYLQGDSSSASASASTTSSNLKFLRSSATAQVTADVYIYPQSGSERPVLNSSSTSEDRVIFEAGWWANTADELASILIYSAGTNSITGKLKLWRLK